MHYMKRSQIVKATKYITIFEYAIFKRLKNYKSLIGLNLFLITCLVIFDHLWKASALKMGAVSIHSDQLLWYIALNEWVLIAIPDIQIDIEYELKSGQLSYQLPRPISYLGAVFSEGFGILCINFLTLGFLT